MSRELLKKLKALKSGDANPREEWVQKNREILLCQIKNTVDAEKENKYFSKNIWESLSYLFNPSLINLALKPMVVLLIVSIVGTSGWIATVDAAYESLPGDILYSAKRATEKTQVTMASVMGDKKAETKLHSEFAKRRAKEAKRIVVSNDPKKSEKVSQSLTDLKKELSSINTKLEGTSESVTALVAKDIKQNTEEIKVTLKEVKDNLLLENTNAVLSQEVTNAKDAVKDTGIKAVQVMVDKHLQGDGTVSKEEVTQVISDTITNVAVDAVNSKQNAEDAKKVVEAVKLEVKDLTKEMTANGASASSTKELTQKLSDVSAQTKEASLKTDVITKEVDKTVTEAKVLLSNGSLNEALGKIMEAAESTKVAEALTDKTIVDVQKVLPVMNVVVKDGVVNTIVTSTPNFTIVVTTTPVVVPFHTVSTSTVVVPTIKPVITVIVSSTVIIK